MGGAIRVSLIFLILFASRQKVWQTSLGKQKKRKELKQILYWLEWKKEHYRQQRFALIILSCCSC